MKNSEKKKHIYLKNYPNVYRIFQKTLRFWYAKAIGSIILCIFMTIISIRLLHKGSIETAILFGFFTLLIGVTTLLYFLGKYQMLTSSDLTKLEKALQTLQKTVGNRFFFTESKPINPDGLPCLKIGMTNKDETSCKIRRCCSLFASSGILETS